MQFSELQKIWDSQNNKPIYVLKEDVLHQKILAKGRKAGKTANTTEWILIFTGLLAAGILVYFDLIRDDGNVYTYVSISFFSLITIYALISRFFRKKRSPNFENTMLGDLENALTISEYQVNLSKGMLFGFWPAVYLVSLLSLIMSDKPIWYSVVFTFFVLLVSFVSRWEYRCYIRRRDELKRLKNKLIEEPEEKI